MISKNSKTVDYLGTNTLIYRDTRAIEKVGGIWETPLKLPGGYKDLPGGAGSTGGTHHHPTPHPCPPSPTGSAWHTK